MPATPDVHFYLCEFVDMGCELPSSTAWAAAVSELHSASLGKSPTGEFGFHVTTHLGDVPVDTQLTESVLGSVLGLADEERVWPKDHPQWPARTLAKLRTAYFEETIPIS